MEGPKKEKPPLTGANGENGSRELLDARMESLAVFSGRIAHEFNNIMNSIMNTAALLKMTGDLSPEMTELVDLIDKSTRRGADLTLALMSFARPVTPQFKATDINAAVQAASDSLLKRLPPGVQMDFRPAPETLEVRLDDVLMGQVFSALLDNSLEAMSPATGSGSAARGPAAPVTGKIEIAVQTVRDSGRDSGREPVVRIVYADTGSGIPDQYRSQIFDPLFSTRQGVKSAGFGLGRAYRLLRDQGGRLMLDPEQPERGARFWIELPVAKPDTVATAPRPAAREAAAPSSGSVRVLLADDDEGNRVLGARLLEKFGHSVTLARDGLEALQIFQAGVGRYDVLVVDESMPGLTGSEVVLMARKARPGMPAILITGADVEPENELVPGIQRILKPYEADAFLHAVTSAAATGTAKTPS